LTGSAVSQVEFAAVRTSGQWLHLMPGASPRYAASSLVLEARRTDLSIAPPGPLKTTMSEDDYGYYGYYDPGGYQVRAPEPGLLFHLGGPDGRSRAFEAMSDSDRWAVVYLRFTNDQPLVGADVGETFSTMWVCRLAVPVETGP
jgi:hypothetical protein